METGIGPLYPTSMNDNDPPLTLRQRIGLYVGIPLFMLAGLALIALPLLLG